MPRYSNRKLKGLPTPKEHVIHSLSDFTNFFSGVNQDRYIYRGENANYFSTDSIALRTGAFLDERNNQHPFLLMTRDFYQEIYYRLKEEEREHFLAFSQHHGIPTNLVDFTRSPIIALFFACQEWNGDRADFQQDIGFVYMHDNRLVDITEVIHGYKGDNFLESFACDDTNIGMHLLRAFSIFFDNDQQQFTYYYQKLIDDILYYFDGFYETICPQLTKKKYLDICENPAYYGEIPLMGEDMCEKALESTFQQYRIARSVFNYTILLRRFLRLSINFKIPMYWINCLPNFVYHPLLTFSRGIKQQGLFLYQGFFRYKDNVYNSEILSRQRIWPTEILVIKEKRKILRELDFLGINDKYIYDDFDSIARYIKKKRETV